MAGPLVVDTETCKLHPDDARPGGRAIAVVSAAWADQDGVLWSKAWAFAQGRYGKRVPQLQATLFDPDPDQLDRRVNHSRTEWLHLLAWLGVAGAGLVFQNAPFDLKHLLRGVMVREDLTDPERRGGWDGLDLSHRLLADTAVQNRDLWPTSEAGLKQTHSRLYGADTSGEAKALRPHLGPATNPRYDLVPWEVMEPYAESDATKTYDLLLHQRRLYDVGEGDRRQVRRSVATALALYRMEVAGLPYDPAASKLVASKLEVRIAEASAALPFLPEDAARYYFGRDRFDVMGQQEDRPQTVTAPDGSTTEGLGLKPYELTEKTGKPVFTADVVDRLARDNKPYAREYADIAKALTANSMWYNGYADATGHDNRLRTVFRAAEGGTRSGRFAAGRVNLQAIPHDHRLSSPLLAGLMSPRAIIGASVKDPGWGLWELDLAQAEMRVAALYAECEPMIDAFRHGRDLHGETATALFNVTADSPDWYKWRSVVAKRANFSLIFGSGWETFRTMVRVQGSVYLTAAESKRIVGDWNALYPQFQRTINHWSDIAGQHRRIQLVGGVTRHFAGFEDTHKAFNQKVQGDLAELGKDWLLETDRYCLEQDLALEGERAGVGLAGLLLVIHDSQVLLLPEDAAGRHTAEVKRLGEQVWSRLFPAIPGGVDVARWKG